MDQRDTDRLAELFEHALALPLEDRRRYARDACGDDAELCSELMSLLAAHDEAPDYLERLAPQLPPAAFAPTRSFEPSGLSESGIENRRSLRVGERFGHYDIGRLLGQGGMGHVWEAADLATGRHVALKAVWRTLRSAADRARFLQEGRLAASVNHPNVVYVFGTEEIEGVPVIAMELAGGGTLKSLVEGGGPMRPAEAVDVVLQVIAGLEAAAAVGVLHRDVKPSNCFIDAEGRIQVGDFGIASAISVQHEASLTWTGGVLGTPTFASPEQLRGAPLDVRSDIYSVGATLYYLLSGCPPFQDANIVPLIERVLHQKPAGLRSVRRDVPRVLDRIILQCLAKSPAERPQSYAHLTRQLLPYGSASRTPAPPGLRVLAVALDTLFVRAVGGALPLFVLAQQQQRVFASRLEWFAFLIAHLVLVLAYFGVTEGVWSASPGKMIVGLRVVSTGRQPIGLKRSLARAFLLFLSVFPAGAAWIALLPIELGAAAWTASLPSYLASAGAGLAGLGILFSKARRANGFAGLHELATETTVVLKLVESTSWRSTRLATPPAMPSAPARLGPYVVLDETAGGDVVVGFDEQLARRVWIRHASPGTPAVSLGRRSVSRPTRPRWLTGCRDTDGGWDAYEAVDGEPLRSATQRPRSWVTIGTWLRDLAQETTAAEEDGTHLPLDLERIWISDGRARLLDWRLDGVQRAGELPGSMDSRDVHRVQHFLHDIAVIGLRVGEPGLNRAAGPAGLPLHAREFLDDLASERFDTTAAIVERLRSSATRPVTVTRARRCAHLALSGAAPLMAVLVFVPALTVLLPLLAESPEAFVIDACLRRLILLERSSSADAAPERTAVETYLVGRFRPLLTEQSTSIRPWFWPMIELRQPTVGRALARQPNPSREEIERAAQQLAGLVADAQRNRELAARGLLGWRLTFFAVLMLIVVSALTAVLSAFFARGGAVFRLLGIAVVAQDGREVSSLRGLARGLIAWTPGIAAFLLLLPFATQRSIEEMPLEQLAPSLLLFAVFVAGTIFALFNPQRGLQDRFTRTSLVAR
jgi:uncharacterized RDD family membrane protein YckC